MDKVVHFEIPADDLKRADKFYSEIFGWQINKTPFSEVYHLANTVETEPSGMPKTPGAINGAIGLRDNKMPHPIIVIKVKSIDKTIEKIEEGGGKLYAPKVAVGPIGFYAKVTDTEGNVIGIWEDTPKK